MAGAPKPANPPRRASSSLSKVSTPTSTTRTSKSSKPSRIVRLKLPSPTLSRFPHEQTTHKAAPTKASPSTPKIIAPSEPATPAETKAVIKPEPKAKPTSAPVSTVPPNKPSPTEDSSQKGLPGAKTGVKRELGAGVEGGIKSRARPGPKKKAKLDNGTDSNGDAASKGTPGAAPAPTHKLGPKANQGAINAGLRALDRSGKPCKKWQKAGFSVKTFTGITWQVTSWRAPKTKKFVLEPGADQPSLPESTSQGKENNNSSSNIGSEKSRSGEVDLPVAASSPIPAIALPA